jgi:hypothetical protein
VEIVRVERPPEVPEGAHYLPPADDFTALRAIHEARADKRSLLRVSFGFVAFRISGMMREASHRSITARPSRRGEYRVWCFTSAGLVPGVWVWTLDDER